MKTSLDHLPEGKRQELGRIVKILFEEFEDALAGRNAPHRKAGRILKVVLFGSYATGKWVDDRKSGYRSDYDLLVVVNHEALTDLAEYWGAADDHLLREYQVTERLTAPANFIVHSFTDVNQQLKRGRPFFTDIARDGIALYEAPDHPLAKPEPLARADALAEAQGYYADWFTTAAGFARNAAYAVNDGDNKLAAFLLHQATERLYHCVLLVLTLYSPKSHKLNFLRSRAEELAPALISAWPRETKSDQRAWELLRRAYVDARYSPNYKISADELGWLSDRIAVLQGLVKERCESRFVEVAEGATKEP